MGRFSFSSRIMPAGVRSKTAFTAASMRLSDRHVVMEKGRVAWAGPSRQLAADASLATRYLAL